MPPENLLFQIGCFLTGSRTTIPPSADTRTLTGSVPSPMRTLGPDGASRTGRDVGAGRGATGAGVCEAEGAGVGWGACSGPPTRLETAPAPRTMRKERIAALRIERVIGDGSLARRAGLTCAPATSCRGRRGAEIRPSDPGSIGTRR